MTVSAEQERQAWRLVRKYGQCQIEYVIHEIWEVTSVLLDHAKGKAHELGSKLDEKRAALAKDFSRLDRRVSNEVANGKAKELLPRALIHRDDCLRLLETPEAAAAKTIWLMEEAVRTERMRNLIEERLSEK